MSPKSLTRGLAALGITAGVLAANNTVAAATIHTAPAVSRPAGGSLHRPPMPCVAVRAGVYPVGAGFCPMMTSAVDWSEFAAAPAAACHATPQSTDDFIPHSRRIPRC